MNAKKILLAIALIAIAWTVVDAVQGVARIASMRSDIVRG